MNNDLYTLLFDLIATPSFSRDEGNACDILQQWMEAHRLQPIRKGHNLWCETPCARQADAPTILLNAHIDTVRPAASYTRNPFTPTVENGRVYGLGSNDDGGSLIALLATYMRLTETKQPYRLIYSATSEEEVSGTQGIDLVREDWGHIDLGIVGEPTSMQMAVAEKGLMVLDCTAHGRSGHAARNEGVNAIYEALEAIEWFRSYRFERVSPYLGEVKMSVTMIGAGTQHNVVPDSCQFVVDVRPNGMYTNRELLERIKESVRVDVQERSTRLNSSHIAEDHPIVVRGRELGLHAFGSPTTSNQTLLPFPTLKIGPGESSRSHTADEYICIHEIDSAIETYYQLLDQIKIQSI